MSTITTRAGKGSPLTNTEMDNNLTNLNTDKLQSGDTAASLTITSADINGGTIDGTAIGGSTPSTAAFTETVITASGSTAALRVTNTGTGNSILVEDDTNPDSSPFVVKADGNVLIGTTTVASSNPKLGVNGALLIGNQSEAGTSGGLRLISASGSNWIQSGANALIGSVYDLKFTGMNGTPVHMTLDSTGNLGIGTTAPTTKLTISNNTVLPSAGAITGTNLWQVGADTTNNEILLDAFGAINRFNFRRAAGTSASPTALTSNSNIAIINGFGYGATGYSSTSRVQINLATSENWTDTAQGTRIVFNTTTNGTATLSERMRIDDAGNVGIGITSPSSYNGKLVVSGNGYFNEGDLTAIRTSSIPTVNILSWQASGYAPSILNINRAGALQTTTPSNSVIGQIRWAGMDAAGTPVYSNFAMIEATIGTNAAGGAPSYMSFYTSLSGAQATERMRIGSAGPLFVTGGSSTALTAVPGSTGNSTVYARLGLTAVNDGVSLPYFQTYNSNASTDLKTWRHGGDSSGNYVFQTVNDAYSSATTELTISSAGALTTLSTISDNHGNVRAAPISATTSGALAATDAGKTISITAGITINASIFSAGDLITVFNTSSTTSFTITQGANVTLRLAATTLTGNRTLAPYGLCSLVCVTGGATPVFVCSGAGLT